jgi:hypothetical protein
MEPSKEGSLTNMRLENDDDDDEEEELELLVGDLGLLL